MNNVIDNFAPIRRESVSRVPNLARRNPGRRVTADPKFSRGAYIEKGTINGPADSMIEEEEAN